MGYLRIIELVKTAVGKWLERKFLDWQSAEGEKKTITEFAEWLGVSRDTLNNWISGRRRPKGKNVEALASKLGPAIYDLLGLQRPDPRLRRITEIAGELPPAAQDELMRKAEELRERERRHRGNAEETTPAV